MSGKFILDSSEVHTIEFGKSVYLRRRFHGCYAFAISFPA